MLHPRHTLVVAVATLCLASAALADVWRSFVDAAAAAHGEAGRAAAEFLAEHRPPRDADIDQALLLENLDYALRARAEFPWARDVPQDLFLNDVLPYASLDETRESWRPDFYQRARRIVAGCRTATEAAQALNRELFNEINVHYNTGRKLPNQSPAESMAQGRATCTGLSIILVDACRAVGIPARIAGVANWSDKRGNHTWVEIWDGDWHFTGADEYNAAGLNRAWFVGDARKATPGSEEHAVWATSWRQTGRHFPMVWDRADRTVPAVDVTERYLAPEDRAAARDAAPPAPAAFIRVWDRQGGQRIEATVELLAPDGTAVAAVISNAGRTDLNDMPELRLAGASPAALRVTYNGEPRIAPAPAPEPGATPTLDLHFDQLGLTEEDAEAFLAESFAARAEQIARDRAGEIESEAFEHAGHTLRILEKTFGDAPEGERSLWISMHGGGGAPADVNDRQWQNQIRLYEPEEGIYIAPRAPTDTWNLWHQAHIDPLFDRLIETYIAARGVDPNRVYLMGYSAGGDGVYQLAPRMADRFAAAAMMAGHPNEAQPLGLRNLPFAILMGGDDGAYNRNTVAAQWGDKLGELREQDPDGYPHEVKIYEGLGHWMDRRDAEILPWMAAHTRDPWPRRVVWRQDDVTHTRFYWLAIDAAEAEAGRVVRAEVEGQRIDIITDDVPAVTLRLRDWLIDLDRPIEVFANGRKVFSGLVLRSRDAVEQSLAERLDPASAATAVLRVEIPPAE